jgi:hypothetical protein
MKDAVTGELWQTELQADPQNYIVRRQPPMFLIKSIERAPDLSGRLCRLMCQPA